MIQTEKSNIEPLYFPCTGCGACCRRAKQTVERLAITDPLNEFYFPYKWDETGRCEMLAEDNKCSVYENRPTVCNIDKTIALSGVDKKKFYTDIIESCNKAMDEDKMPLEYRI